MATPTRKRGSSRPRLTARILNGVATALAHATAGGPADIGLCADSEKDEAAPEVQRRWQEVCDAYDWAMAMRSHRESKKESI